MGKLQARAATAARAFAVVLVAAGATYAAPPKLSVVRQPFTVHGIRFHPNERVKVTMITTSRRTFTVKTSAAGRFTLVRRDVLIPRCGVFTVQAAGTRGDRAVYKSPAVRCG